MVLSSYAIAHRAKQVARHKCELHSMSTPLTTWLAKCPLQSTLGVISFEIQMGMLRRPSRISGYAVIIALSTFEAFTLPAIAAHAAWSVKRMARPNFSTSA